MNIFLTMQLFAAGAFVIGLAAMIGGFWFRRRALRSLNWREVKAEVLEFDLVYQDDTDFPHYEPRIHYRYVFGGQTFEGKVFRPVFNVQVGAVEVDEWRQQYQPGNQIVVHVNPDIPAQAAVKKYVPKAPFWILLLIGSGFAFLGAVMFAVMTFLSQIATQ